ncbi:efflux RND transporter periplasmic adaptor subunit [Algoriphagus sp. AK58]|uniref:efflux RND transporter periplasmic adaptor subunit n=1 Tax=Algoriphagus sp. AK58 TaxID=1406877 RepID=UPI00164FF30F|nr:efflux RND transporter periplasmic adaptor subunit [Algoriphagus sp. AK58]MBC6368513.1 HlyD family secretion protein [Algoriphagus sp. AK58]
MKTAKLTILAHLGATLLILSTSCSKNESSENGIEVAEAPEDSREIVLTEDQFRTMKMEWGPLHTGEFSEEITVQGTVQIPVEGMREISAYYGGYVQDLKLLEGEAVKKGEVLFTLENPDFIRLQQDYLETRSQLTYLKAEFERQRILASEQISAQKNLIKAEADYQSALAKTESLKKQLSLIQINAEQLTPESIKTKVAVTSPISGFVEGVWVVPGQFLPAAGKAVSLLSKDHIHVELVLFEKDANRVHPGQKVEFSSPDKPGEVMEAKIYVVGQSINEQRQINVHAHLLDDGQESKLTPGMFLQARIQLDPKISLAVPEESVLEVDQERYILIQKAKTESGFVLEKVKVIPGAKGKHYLAIEPEKALDSTTVVLVKGGFNLL